MLWAERSTIFEKCLRRSGNAKEDRITAKGAPGCVAVKGQRGPQKVRCDPPLSSSRACLHTAFIAFSVHCVFGRPFDCPLAQCSQPIPPCMGQGSWPVGSGLYRRVTLGLCNELGRGFYVCSMLACSDQGVLAMAGLTRPHTCSIVRSKGKWGGGGLPQWGMCNPAHVPSP